MRWVFLAALLLAGCRGEEAPVPPPATALPPACAAGEGWVDGQCQALLHRGICPPGSMAQLGTEGCVPVGPAACGDGFAPAPSGWGCAPVVAASCPAGARRALGRTDCVAVGVPTCAAGFERDATGFGCREIAAESCTGATRAQLGESGCVRVGDCGAPFPPADATLFVKRAYTAGELDATHFDSIGAALAAAPAGAVIAVDEGTYVEELDVASPVHLVGRCAEKVRLEAPPGSTGAGVDVHGATGVLVSGLTVSGHFRGAHLRGMADVEISDCVFEGNVSSALTCTDSTVAVRSSALRDTGGRPDGLFGRGVDLAGCKASLTDVHVQRNHEFGIRIASGGEATMAGVVIDETLPNVGGLYGYGLYVRGPARAAGQRLVARKSRSTAVAAQGADAAVELSDVVLADTVPSISPAGAGLAVAAGGAATLTRATFRGCIGVATTTSDGTVTVKQSSVGRVVAPAPGGTSTGFDIAGGSQATLEDVAVFGNEGYGVRAVDPGTSVTVRRSLLTANRYLGLFAALKAQAAVEDSELSKNLAGVTTADAGSRAVVRGSLLVEAVNTSTDPTATYGGLLASKGATLEAERCLVADNEDFGALIETGASLALKDSVVHGNRSVRFKPLGDGVYVRDSAFTASGTTFLDNQTTNVRGNPASSISLADCAVRQDHAPLWLVGVATSGKVRLARTAAVDLQIIAIAGLAPGSEVSLEQCLVGPTHGISGQHGYGVTSVGRFEIVGSELRQSEVAAVVASHATGSIRASVLRGNTVALHAQGGSTLVESDRSAPEPLEVLLSPDTVLLDNETRVGSGTLALPGVGGP